MSEFFRKYWFICLIAAAMICALIYYIADLNKDQVSARTSEGKDVVASTTVGDVTSDDIYEKYQSFNQTLLYNMYSRAVVDQSVEATDDMKATAKTMTKTIKTNMDSDATNATRYSIISELAGYGFEGEDSLYDYCLYALKQKELDRTYIADHFDDYKDTLTTSPRTISIITMEVPNAEILTEDAQTKQDNIDKALAAGDDFGSVATAFSEDVITAANEGFYGYVDSSTTALDSAVVSAAVSLKKGETSDWITTSNSTTGTYVLYKVYVNETDMESIFNSENTDVQDAILNAILSANSGLEAKAIENAAKDLDITFEDEAVKSQIESYIQTQIGEASDEK